MRRGSGVHRRVDADQSEPSKHLVVDQCSGKALDRRDPRTSDGNFVTSSIPQIAERIDQALRRLPKLLKIQVRLLSVHRSERTVSNGPSAPSSPNKALMMSIEVCTYLRAVAEAATAKKAGTIYGSPDQLQQPSRDSSLRRGRTPSRASGGVAGPVAVLVADEGPGAAAAVVALAVEAAQAVAVGPPLSTVALTTTNGR